MSKDGKKFALGVAIAAGIGYAAGLLTAPKSGKDTRKDISKVAKNTKREIETKIKSLHGELNGLISASNARLKTLTGSAKSELEKAVTKAKNAKSKAREVLSALHEGEADDTDLDVAIKDLKAAIERLKKFAKKS